MIDLGKSHPEILSIISRPGKNEYCCPVCSSALEMNNIGDLYCSLLLPGHHQINFKQYSNFSYQSFDLWFLFDKNGYTASISYDTGTSYIATSKYSKYSLTFDFIIPNINFSNLNSIVEQIDLYFLLS